MRITAGKWRGKHILSPEGLKTRPTGDRARQAIFNILNHARWLGDIAVDGAAVLDLFAGTGALGLEALSQGAAHAVFVENDPAASKLVRQNIEAMDFTKNAALLKADATALPPRPAHTDARHIVFLDPPYGQDVGARALQSAAKGGWLAEKAVCVFEMAKKTPEQTPPGFTVMDERAYGAALVRFLIFTG